MRCFTWGGAQGPLLWVRHLAVTFHELATLAGYTHIRHAGDQATTYGARLHQGGHPRTNCDRHWVLHLCVAVHAAALHGYSVCSTESMLLDAACLTTMMQRGLSCTLARSLAHARARGERSAAFAVPRLKGSFKRRCVSHFFISIQNTRKKLARARGAPQGHGQSHMLT